MLTAVDQRETVMKALQDAVPEDVRGKLRAGVSGIFHNQGTNFKLDGLLNIGSLPTMGSESKSKTQENAGGLSSVEGYVQALLRQYTYTYTYIYTHIYIYTRRETAEKSVNLHLFL